MKKKTMFIIARFNEPDLDGDIILPSAIKEKEVWLTKDFDKPIGKVKISHNENELIGEAEIDESYKGLYPAIGFRTIRE